jgi:hypothetical protein
MTTKRGLSRHQFVRGSAALNATLSLPRVVFALSKGDVDLPDSSWMPAARLAARRERRRRSWGFGQARSPRRQSDGLKSLQITPLFWPIY